MQAVILVNGLIQNYTWVLPWLEKADLHIAADGGLGHFTRLNRRPHAVVGDLDSVDAQALSELEAAGVDVKRYRPEKDKTDLELALEYALAAGATEILLLGALGGRLDQTLANLLILAQREWPAALSIVEENQIATVIRPGHTVHIQGVPGNVVSLIPLTGQVCGITYTGLRYPLDNATLPFGSTRGVSNEMATPQATVRITDGLALLIREFESGS